MTTETQIEPARPAVQELDEVVIRFAGDSGDGMQLTGSQFADTTALVGNDLSTLPDYPAEIRAPAGTLAGVSGYQINFSSHDIRHPGDAPNVLVAMNPAALKSNIGDIEPGEETAQKDFREQQESQRDPEQEHDLDQGHLRRERVGRLERRPAGGPALGLSVDARHGLSSKGPVGGLYTTGAGSAARQMV